MNNNNDKLNKNNKPKPEKPITHIIDKGFNPKKK